MSDTTANPDAAPDIAKLVEAADNLSALSERWADKGEDLKALDLSNQAVALRNQITQLRAQKRADLTATPQWTELAQYMDQLNTQAQQTAQQMQDAEGDVETAKSLISGVGKLIALL